MLDLTANPSTWPAGKVVVYLLAWADLLEERLGDETVQVGYEEAAE